VNSNLPNSVRTAKSAGFVNPAANALVSEGEAERGEGPEDRLDEAVEKGPTEY
jgi:hypothetical protein